MLEKDYHHVPIRFGENIVVPGYFPHESKLACSSNQVNKNLRLVGKTQYCTKQALLGAKPGYQGAGGR